MIGLTSLEVYNSVFNTTQEISKFELYADNFDEFSFRELKDELDEVSDISDTTPEDIQNKIMGPRIVSA